MPYTRAPLPRQASQPPEQHKPKGTNRTNNVYIDMNLAPEIRTITAGIQLVQVLGARIVLCVGRPGQLGRKTGVSSFLRITYVVDLLKC